MTDEQTALGRVLKRTDFYVSKGLTGTAVLGPKRFYLAVQNPALAAAIEAFLCGDIVAAVDRRAEFLDSL